MFDFFIAHAGRDFDRAEQLHRLLQDDSRVFLDGHTLQGGDNWGRLLSEALENSKVIVFLISHHIHNAYYFLEEIARAIQLQREHHTAYKIVPVYLDGFPEKVSDIPYGLYQLHALDLVREGSYESVSKKLLEFLSAMPDSQPDAVKLKSGLSFSHVLHQFPVGPMVDGYLVSTKVIEAFAALIDESHSLQVIHEANAFRKEADPEESGSITIKIINLPSPAKNSSKVFWLEAFKEARLHGPRMLAALLLSIDYSFAPEDAIREKDKLLQRLLSFHNA